MVQTHLPFGEQDAGPGRPPVRNGATGDQNARERIQRDLDATLFVEAGAGTGKTRELIERIVRLVAGGRVELRRIAAITFTESAASELQDRLRERLEEAARDDSISPVERELCRRAADEIDAAAIETLHAFAQRIITDHPLEAGLPPIIEVQDEIQASIAFDERWARFVDELLDDKSMEETLVRALTLELKISELRQVATAFHENWDRLEDAAFEAAPQPASHAEPILDLLTDACTRARHCSDPEDKLLLHLQRLGRYRARLAAQDNALDRLRVLAEGERIKTTGGKQEYWRGVRPGDIRDTLVEAHRLRDELIAAERAAVLPPLLEAVRRFVLAYADERRRQGRLEFHDLLVQARDLLRRDAAVRRDVRDQYSHLLIDEFQDTDPLQIEIASLIAMDGAGGEPPPWHDASIEAGRLFFVGDPKQSIYAFRRADIVLYQRAQQRFAETTVRLTANFRSTPPLLHWVNHVFDALMGAGPVDGQAAYVALAGARPPIDGGATVRLLGGPRPGMMDEVRHNEAKEIARIIRQAKAEGWPVADRDGATRPARYCDIAVLMPARTTLPPIEDALEDAGIPYRVESRSLVYETQEVRDLLSVLRAIDDPTDEVALIASLRSAALACSDDDLLRYYQAGGRWDYRRDPPGLPENDPVVTAMAWLQQMHRRRWWEPISSVVEAVIHERRMFELAFAHRRPRERWQRLRFVLDQSRAFAEAGGRTLRQFIDWADRQADEGTRVVETVVPEPDDDAVRIMTIHAAKGLEFPIVVLAGLNSERGSQPQKEPVLWDEAGVAQVAAGSFETPGYDAAAVRHEQLEAYEKVRLLYVAATRARDHLIVSLHHKQGQECHAKRLAERIVDAPQLSVLVQPLETLVDAPEGPAATFDDTAQARRLWLDGRQRQIAALARAPRVSAVEIAKGARDDDPNLRKDVPVEEVPPWRRGRAGTALGRAVHAVLQSIDLAGTGDIAAAARAQSAAEGIAARADDVERLVRVALASPAVREAVAGGRYWREVYVSAPIDGVTIEGFVDLLYETPQGLVVVDYKTDALPDEARLDEALARYRLQGAAYALALREALGRPVARCTFVLMQARDATDRDIEDLDQAIADVRERLPAAAAG